VYPSPGPLALIQPNAKPHPRHAVCFHLPSRECRDPGTPAAVKTSNCAKGQPRHRGPSLNTEIPRETPAHVLCKSPSLPPQIPP
jgi:hypothetical protein